MFQLVGTQSIRWQSYIGQESSEKYTIYDKKSYPECSFVHLTIIHLPIILVRHPANNVPTNIHSTSKYKLGVSVLNDVGRTKAVVARRRLPVVDKCAI